MGVYSRPSVLIRRIKCQCLANFFLVYRRSTRLELKSATSDDFEYRNSMDGMYEERHNPPVDLRAQLSRRGMFRTAAIYRVVRGFCSSIDSCFRKCDAVRGSRHEASYDDDHADDYGRGQLAHDSIDALGLAYADHYDDGVGSRQPRRRRSEAW